jgi:DNA-binding NtrC family response regulator
MAVRWRLHVIASPDRAACGRVYELSPGQWTLGRAPESSANILPIHDTTLSRCHARLDVQQGTERLQIRDLDSRNGTFCNGARIKTADLGHAGVMRVGATVLIVEADLGRRAPFEQPTADVPGQSEVARMIRGELDDAAADNLPALIQGDTGTGKEHAAMELHRRSGRRGRLVRFNVAAVPESLFEGELFGHVAGAFTGATAARPGRVRESQGGTLVLDEIGELPMVMQAKLLRMLEERTVRPVGANTDFPVDVRYVASTNADLQRLVNEGRFRRDLLARLRSHVVHLPPLCKRLPDLLDLADVVAPLADEKALRPSSWRQALPAEVLEILLRYQWPDNLRELRAVLRQAARRLAEGAEGLQVLPEALLVQMPPIGGPPDDVPRNPGRILQKDRPDASALYAMLAEYQGNIDQIAKATGRHRRQVYRWLTYAGIDETEVDRYRRGEL